MIARRRISFAMLCVGSVRRRVLEMSSELARGLGSYARIFAQVRPLSEHEHRMVLERERRPR